MPNPERQTPSRPTRQNPFLWGAAISAHQTEGLNSTSDWWAFEQDVLAQKGAEPSGSAVDHWHRYREDIDLLANAGLNAFRFSIEWARVEPEQGTINEDAVRHYADVLAYAKSKGIHTCVTLWHFTLPAWAASKGGILSHEVRGRFAAYAGLCGSRFKKDVDLWLTMNEPMVYLMEGYRHGRWPPCERSKSRAVRAFFALRSMHRRAYEALKRQRIEQIGIAASAIAYLTDPSSRIAPILKLIQAFHGFIWNAMFFVGEKHRHDFIALNYYITDIAGSRGEDREPSDDMGWKCRPEGLRALIRWASKKRLPIYITENGTATNDDGARIQYLQKHLDVIDGARKEGIPIFGYFHWSLLDNFEWDKGFSKPFGLVAVDRETFERTPKASLWAYGEYARRRI
jgi:beta-glucosidase